MKVFKLSNEEWTTFSENAHKVVFSEIKPSEMDRIDYALLVAEEKPIAYVTCREMDKETIYWQFGGAFPETRGTTRSFRAYQTLVNCAQEHYKRIVTYIENTNLVMLKMAMAVGFRITGIRLFNGSVLLEHLLEF